MFFWYITFKGSKSINTYFFRSLRKTNDKLTNAGDMTRTRSVPGIFLTVLQSISILLPSWCEVTVMII